MKFWKWRKMTWVLWVWSIGILVWAVGGGASNNCSAQHGDAFLTAHQAQNACAAGTGIGVALILLVGFVGFVFFSIIWFMSRPKGRDCPVCGELVKKGRTTCKGCGHDFRAALGEAAHGTVVVGQR